MMPATASATPDPSHAPARFLLILLRSWHFAGETWWDDHADNARHLYGDNAAPAMAAIDRLMAVLAEQADRPIRLRPPACARRSPEENSLLRAYDALKLGDHDTARGALGDLLSGDALALAETELKGLVRAADPVTSLAATPTSQTQRHLAPVRVQ